MTELFKIKVKGEGEDWWDGPYYTLGDAHRSISYKKKHFKRCDLTHAVFEIYRFPIGEGECIETDEL